MGRYFLKRIIYFVMQISMKYQTCQYTSFTHKRQNRYYFSGTRERQHIFTTFIEFCMGDAEISAYFYINTIFYLQPNHTYTIIPTYYNTIGISTQKVIHHDITHSTIFIRTNHTIYPTNIHNTNGPIYIIPLELVHVLKNGYHLHHVNDDDTLTNNSLISQFHHDIYVIP